MTLASRGSLGWLGMVIAGLALGGYVVAAWPDTTPQVVRLPYGEALPKTPAASSQPVRVTASVGVYAESELADVAGAIYLDELFVYEFGPTPMLDTVIGAPLPVDAG